MAVRRTPTSRILEQEVGNSRVPRLMFRFHRHFDNHSVHARRLGRLSRRIPGNDREGSIPDERSRSSRCLFLLAAAGRDKGFAGQDNDIRLKHDNFSGRRCQGTTRRGGPDTPMMSRLSEAFASLLRHPGAGIASSRELQG